MKFSEFIAYFMSSGAMSLLDLLFFRFLRVELISERLGGPIGIGVFLEISLSWMVKAGARESSLGGDEGGHGLKWISR